MEIINFLFKILKGYTVRTIFIIIITGLMYSLLFSASFLPLPDYFKLDTYIDFIYEYGGAYFFIMFISIIIISFYSLLIRKYIRLFIRKNKSKAYTNTNMSIKRKYNMIINVITLKFLDEINIPPLECNETSSKTTNGLSLKKHIDLCAIKITYAFVFIIISLLLCIVYSKWFIILMIYFIIDEIYLLRYDKYTIFSFFSQKTLENELKNNP